MEKSNLGKKMLKDFISHAFGLRDVEYCKTDYPKGEIRIHVKTEGSKLVCSSCSSKNVVKKGIKERIFRTVPIGLKPVYIVAQVQRLECKDCGVTRQEHLSWVDKKKLIPVD